MPNLTVTAKGQVTFRKELLEHLGVRPGGTLAVEKLPDGRAVVRAAPKAGKISAIFGALKRADRPRLSIAQIDAVAARGWARGR